MKTWTYEEITENAEMKIKSLMQISTSKKNTSLGDLFHQWAFGVFIGWKNLTLGHMNEGDYKRLEALTEGDKE